MSDYVHLKPPKTVIFKTIQEFCKEDINIELEALDIFKRLKFATADDLHVLDPSLEKMKLSHCVYGSAIHNLVKAGKIRFIRYVPSSRAIAHYRPIGEYEYVRG